MPSDIHISYPTGPIGGFSDFWIKEDDNYKEEDFKWEEFSNHKIDVNNLAYSYDFSRNLWTRVFKLPESKISLFSCTTHQGKNQPR